MSYSRGTLIKTLWWLNLLHSFTHPTHLLSTYVPSTVHNRMNKENVVRFAKSSPFSGETYIKQTVAQSVFVGTSLVVQRLGLCLPMQGTWFPALVWELRSHIPSASTSFLLDCHPESPSRPSWGSGEGVKNLPGWLRGIKTDPTLWVQECCTPANVFNPLGTLQ